jgi:hypothetical protein
MGQGRQNRRHQGGLIEPALQESKSAERVRITSSAVTRDGPHDPHHQRHHQALRMQGTTPMPHPLRDTALVGVLDHHQADHDACHRMCGPSSPSTDHGTLEGRALHPFKVTRWSACSVTARQYFTGRPMTLPIKGTTKGSSTEHVGGRLHHRMFQLEVQWSAWWASIIITELQGPPHGSFPSGVASRATSRGGFK